MNPNRHKSCWRYRWGLFLGLVLLVPLGYSIRFLGPTPDWFKDYFGSIAYEIFWIVLVLFVWPQTRPRVAACWVFFATCGIEFLQLWHPPFLEALRATLPGRLVLGNTFAWSDFPAYSVGCLAGWGFAHLWTKQRGRR